MIKSMQAKIVMVFMILGIILIAGLGSIFLYKLNDIDSKILEISNHSAEVEELLTNQLENEKKIIIISLIIFIGLTVIL